MMIKSILLRGLVSSALLSFSFPNVATAANFSANILATGLANPRGLTMDAAGNIYVAESGIGGSAPCISTNQGLKCYGTTGKIGVYQRSNDTYTTLISNLPSVASPNGDDATGISDLAFDSNGNLYGVIGLGGDVNTRNALGDSNLGNIISVNITNIPTANWSSVADITQYEQDNNPDGEDIDSNPYSLAVGNNGIYVSDAGGNTLLQAQLNGTVDLVEVFPRQGGTQSVPTGVAIGPDDNPYVGQLTGVPFPSGAADVFTINNAMRQTFATGFTAITDIAFAPDGSLYVLEYSSNFFANAPGSVWQIQTNGQKNLIYTDASLINPTGIFVEDNNTIFVTNKGASGTDGELLLISPVSTPESSVLIGLSSMALFGAFSLKKR